MEHLAYYNTGCEPEPGFDRVWVGPRRLLRKLLLPASKRLVQILTSLVDRLDRDEHEIHVLQHAVEDLRRRQEDVAEKFPTTVAFGWDYVAMVRRLAVLEDHVADLLAAHDAAPEVLTSSDGISPLAHVG